jgi:hypothetical protein
MDKMQTEEHELDQAFFAMLQDAGLSRWVARRMLGLTWPRCPLDLFHDLLKAGTIIDIHTIIDYLAAKLNVPRGRITEATLRTHKLSRRDAVDLVRFAATHGPRPGTERYNAIMAARKGV